MTYPLGAPVPFTWPGTSTSATLTVTLPDGTTNTPTVTGSAGSWASTYTPTQVGRHTYRWTGTSPVAASVPDVFEVLPVSAGSIVSLADLRGHLGWPSTKSTADDAELLDLATGASDTIEGYLGRPVRRQTFTELHTPGKLGLPLRHRPCPCSSCQPGRVLTVTTVVENGATLSAAAGDYTLDSTTGIVWRGPTTLGSAAWMSVQQVSVTYVAGYTSTPQWAQMATKRLVEHLWTRSQQARHTRGGSEPAESTPSPTYLLPYLVQSLLDPHKSGGW